MARLPKSRGTFVHLRSKVRTMERNLMVKLLQWKEAVQRKPLLLFGARQVGKTWLMKSLGALHFENHVYVNFEKEPKLSSLFEGDYNPERIIKLIEIQTQQKIQAGRTLLILDEIQEAGGGLTSLKYFHEEMPDLHIVAAGSLMGITISQKTSFPVGKVDFQFVFPLSFDEFLKAKNRTDLAELVYSGDWDAIAFFKEDYIHLLKQYYFVGGMPEAVSAFTEKSSYSEVRKIQNSILKSYELDFAKHAPGAIIQKISLVWNNVLSQLSKENKKFIYNVLRTGARARDYEIAIDWLQNYGLIHKIYCVNKVAKPLKSYRDVSTFKIYHLDVGLLGAMGGISEKTILENDVLFQEFKGALTEQFTIQQLIPFHLDNLHYWTNQNGSAEIDVLFEHGHSIVPLEVKASENLQSKSLRLFFAKHPEIRCYRTSMSNYRNEEWLTNIPLYAIFYLDGSKD
jgi:predicted AAA+ superfamily ATPase